MCGITGVIDLRKQNRIHEAVLLEMVNSIKHRGPDKSSIHTIPNVGFGFVRLSIVDLVTGDQPLFNEDRTIFLICNGEIFNYPELRNEVCSKGHVFKTNSDCEVILHLYEMYGENFISRLNGQFAFALYDTNKNILLAARDHFGVAPFFYTFTDDGFFIFGSEIKAILAHPDVKREVDLVGLDQIFTFPGLISPRTLFKNIKSLANGHSLVVNLQGDHHIKEYWDLIYPHADEINYQAENYYVERLSDLFSRSVQSRLQSDVPIGFYISGGLDSAMTSAKTMSIDPKELRDSFSINVAQTDLSEQQYQKIMVEQLQSRHREYLFDTSDIIARLKKVVFHAEAAIKESYDTAALALSEMVNQNKNKVILAGQGADEIFGGYIGYRFDQFKKQGITPKATISPEDMQAAEQLWGDKDFVYEKYHYSFRQSKLPIYSAALQAEAHEFDCLNHFVINKDRLKNIDILHKRSYIDYKLRLCDHLLADHGDRMAFANSVEGRYPFLDKDFVEFATLIPPDLKVKDFEEKYILKQVAKSFVPTEIIQREKFGFAAPGSPFLLRQNVEYIQDILSYDKIKREGYFDPDHIEALKKQYSQPDFHVNVPFDTDLLIVVITFGIFLENFKMPSI